MASTFYLSNLIKEVGPEKAFLKATELRSQGHNVIVDAESIIDRNGDEAWDILDGLKKKGYNIKINSATIDRIFKQNNSQAYDLAAKRGWQIYSQPTPQQRAEMATPLEPAHLPAQERTAMFASMMESPHQVAPPPTPQVMRAATPAEQQAMMRAPVPAPAKSAEEMNAEWAARRGLTPSMIDPNTYVKPRPEPQTIPGRAAERVLNVSMPPMAAGMRLVLLPENYWTASKALSNVLSNSTGQAANALGLGKYAYTDWYNSRSKSLDQDLQKVLGPIEDVTTVLWRDPIVGLGILGSTTRTIADMSVTPFTSEQTGARISAATLKDAPLTAAMVDPVGSAFESVGDVAAKAYEMAGGSPGTADKIRGLGTVAMLAAFNYASAARIRSIREKVDKGQKLAPEEQAVVDQVAPMQNPEAVKKSLEELELSAKTNAEVLDKAKENKIVTSAVEPQGQIPLAPEVQSAEVMAKLKPQEVANAESLRENAGRVQAVGDVRQGGEVQGGADLQRQAQVKAGNAPEQVTHQMPSGEIMPEPEHPGAVPGSTSPVEAPPPVQMQASSPIGMVVEGAKRLTQPAPRPDLAEKPRSLFDEPEQYFEQNKGIQIQELSRIQKIRESLVRIKQAFSRSRPNIDPRASVPEAVTQETLRRYQDAPERAQINAVDTVADFTKGLGPNRKDLLYRVAMLEDLKYDLEKGLTDINEKPLGYDTTEKLEADLQRMRSTMLSDPKTSAAYQRRNELFRPIVEQLVEAGRLPEEALERPAYYHHQVLEHYNEGGKKLGSKDLRLYKKGFEMQRTGSAKALNTEGVESDFEWLSQAYYQLHTLEAQAKIQQAADITQRLKNEAQVIEEETGQKTKSVIPEGYVEWQVPPNHPFYNVNTVNDKIMDALMNEGEALVKPEDVRKQLAVGNAETWIIPENLAKELNNIGHYKEGNVVGDAFRGVNNAWKRWVILNPWRATKYMLNNLTGDLDAVISIAPGALKTAPKRSVQLWNKMWKNQSTPEFDALYNKAMEKSVLQSGMTLEEIPDVKKLPALRLLQATLNDKHPFWKRPDKMVSEAFDTYWRNTNMLNIWRESVLRLSAFDYWMKKVNTSGKRQYGASDRATIDQMYEAVKEGKLELDDVAARLARDTLGDYGNVSQAGQWMRRTTHPFWSWVEINVPRYYHLFKNIAAEGSAKDIAGQAAYTGAKLAGKTAWKAAKVYAFSQAFFAAVNLHNKTLYPEEDKLINKAKGELYLITPFRNDDGSRRVVRFSGALSDALSMFGLLDYLRDIPELIQGKQQAKDVAWQVLSSVPEQAWQRLGPGIKAPPEIVFQRQTYPRALTENWPKSARDVLTTGRPVRSGAQQAWKYLALDWAYNGYKRAIGEPFPQRDAALADLISTSVDTNQAAYYAIREKAFDFMREHDRENPPPSQYKDKANAAYFFKVASQIDDKDAAKYWFKQYMEYSKKDYAEEVAYGNEKKDFFTWSLDNLNKSIEASAPLGALKERYRAAFIQTLTPEEKEMLNAAMRWYHAKLPHRVK